MPDTMVTANNDRFKVKKLKLTGVYCSLLSCQISTDAIFKLAPFKLEISLG